MPLLIDVKQNVPELPDFDLEFIVGPSDDDLVEDGPAPLEDEDWPSWADEPKTDPYDRPSNWSNS